MSNTLSVSSFNLILYSAQQRGAEYNVLCEKVGLTADMLQDPDARLPIRKVQELWKEAVEMTGDEHLALHIGESINTVAVGILAYVMMHCPTLGKALEKLCQYQDIVCDGSKTEFYIKDDLAYVTLTQLSEDMLYPQYAFESELSIYNEAVKGMLGRALPLHAVHFNYPAYSPHLSEYQRIFKTEQVLFESDITGIVFDKKYLDYPILNANPNLFPLFDKHAQSILSSLKQDNSIKEKVKKEILDGLKGEEPSLFNISRNLGIGLRSLQMKLKEEGVTFQQLLDDIRKNLAVQHLQETHLSTTDIAYLLGYSEPSVFFRSFKKWTGYTPNVYRKNPKMVA
ncbi:AraC family transcriptional regulator [Arcicella aquatica]|uniref:AraC family transcriptional regulator n=1 Tax=Arcicella aquatica TaxID=217141 RepID=A0ABU5QR53_9BACT|nr:AraC family transcriptional regulator [Arcicella aquatica]MEA5258876.1 AraC family transcriptional regulator [Arcicella aquatica]